MRGLMDSPRTDAERAGERLAVFGWQVDGPDHTLRWVYRIVGEDTGEEHARFILAVPWAPSDLPCRLLGLQLQITLNGVENASSGSSTPTSSSPRPLAVDAGAGDSLPPDAAVPRLSPRSPSGTTGCCSPPRRCRCWGRG